MPNITLNLSQSVTGVFTATPRNSFKAVNSNNIVIQQIYTANITSGTATLNLPQSNHAKVTYLFEAYQTTTHFNYFFQNGDRYTTDDASDPISGKPFYQWTNGSGFNNEWYSGKQVGTSAPTTDNKLLNRVAFNKRTPLIQPFDAVVTATDDNVANMIDIGITTAQLDYSAAMVADLLTMPPYVSRLPKGVTFVGPYNAATIYTKDQAVQYDGSLWIWIDSSNGSGVTPGTNPAKWELGVSKGASGGTGANSIGYNHATFADMMSDAASRSDLRGGVQHAIANSAAPDLSNYARRDTNNDFSGVNRFQVPLDTEPLSPVTLGHGDGRYLRLSTTQTVTGNKTFSGAIIVPTRSANDNTANAASTAFVRGELNAFVPGRMAAPVADVSRSTSQTLTVTTNSGVNGDVIVWNNFPIAGFFNSVGDWNVPIGVPTDTMYWFQGVATLNVSCNFSSSGDRRVMMRLHGSVGSTDIGNACVITVPTFNGSAVYTLPFSRVYKMSANQSFQLRLHIFDSFGSTVTSASLTASSANNFVNVWRVN